MSTLTYKSFLKSYVRHLSYNETLHLNPLLDEAENKHPRLREILILYMMEHDRLDKLIDKKIKFPSMYKLYDENRHDLLNESYKTDQESPFYKVFNSYKVKRDYRNKFKRN